MKFCFLSFFYRRLRTRRRPALTRRVSISRAVMLALFGGDELAAYDYPAGEAQGNGGDQ